MGILIEFNYKVLDGKNQRSLISFYSSTGIVENSAELQLMANALMPLIRNVITGGIMGCSVSFHPVLSDLFTSFPSLRIPDPASDVEEGAIVRFIPESEPPSEHFTTRIPSFDEDLLHSGTREINVADLRFQAFIESVLNPNIMPFTTARGMQLFAYQKGAENFKKRKKRRTKR